MKFLDIPSKCPICGENTFIITENKTKILMCLNAKCEGKLKEELCSFVGKKAHNIKGLSEATLSLMIQTGIVKDVRDIYYLKNKRKELTYFPKMGDKKVDNILKAIEESRNTTLAKFIVGLNIPLIGSHAAKDIERFEEIRAKNRQRNSSIEMFFEDVAYRTDFTNIDGFGLERNKSIHDYFKTNLAYVKELANEFIFPEITNEKKNQNNKFNGRKFCITGKLNKFLNRDQLINDIENKGGRVVSNVTSSTDFLITNNKDSDSSKNKKANEFNILIISEEEYLKL